MNLVHSHIISNSEGDTCTDPCQWAGGAGSCKAEQIGHDQPGKGSHKQFHKSGNGWDEIPAQSLEGTAVDEEQCKGKVKGAAYSKEGVGEG